MPVAPNRGAIRQDPDRSPIPSPTRPAAHPGQMGQMGQTALGDLGDVHPPTVELGGERHWR